MKFTFSTALPPLAALHAQHEGRGAPADRGSNARLPRPCPRLVARRHAGLAVAGTRVEGADSCACVRVHARTGYIQLARRAAQPGVAERLRDGRSFVSLMEYCALWEFALTWYRKRRAWCGLWEGDEGRALVYRYVWR